MRGNMTVGDLIALLEECDENAEVRMAYQPHYPLESTIEGIASSLTVDPDGDEGSEEGPADVEIIYILEGQQTGYANAGFWANPLR